MCFQVSEWYGRIYKQNMTPVCSLLVNLINNKQVNSVFAFILFASDCVSTVGDECDTVVTS